MKRFLPLIALLFVVSLAQAEMYRWVDEEGNVQFSDTPPPEGVDAERMEIPEPSVVETYKPTPSSSDDEDEAAEGEDDAKPVKYRRLAIVSPANDEAVRENAGNVTIKVEIRPELQPGHRLRIYLDDERLDNGGTRTTVSLSNVSRGTHTIRAEIVDGDGKVLRRVRSTFHLLRAVAGEAPFKVTPGRPPGPARPSTP